MFKIRNILFVSAIFNTITVVAQVKDTTEEWQPSIAALVHLDSIVVKAAKAGFDVEDFIRRVEEDQSFYIAFHNLRLLSYQSDNSIRHFDKKRREQASYHAAIAQISDGNCRTMQYLKEESTGNFFKNKKKRTYKWYTARMFDRLFFTHGRVCESDAGQSGGAVEDGQEGAMEKHVNQLKKLIFQPGEEVNVPLIGKKTALFSDRLSSYYDYSVTSRVYDNGIDCFVFSALVKPEYLARKEGKTVIKQLETFFDKSNYQVVARNYQLQYEGPLFDFDVSMQIRLGKLGDLYVPQWLQYDGYWDVPAHKPEICRFEAKFYSFQSPTKN